MNTSLNSAANRGAIERLNELGFTRSEALAYLILLDAHPATAYEISKRGALSKANVYAALQSLVQKGAVQPVSDEPVRYAPVEPEALFSAIAKNTATVCRDLADALASREQQKALEYVWIVAGEQPLHDKVLEMVHAAREQIWIKAPHHLLEPYVPALKDAARRGVAILVILFGRPEDQERLALGPQVRCYLHEGSGDMLAVGSTQFVIAADWSGTLIADFGAAPHGAYTHSRSVVFMAETMIRHEVYLAEIMSEFGPAIEKRFGKDLLSLRRHYLPSKLLDEVHKRTSARAGDGARAAAPKKRAGPGRAAAATRNPS